MMIQLIRGSYGFEDIARGRQFYVLGEGDEWIAGLLAESGDLSVSLCEKQKYHKNHKKSKNLELKV